MNSNSIWTEKLGADLPNLILGACWERKIHSHRTFRIALLLILIALLVFKPRGISAQSGVDLVVHYVGGQPSTNAIAYDVSVFLSAVDASGSPITDLAAENLTVTEDSRPVEIQSFELAVDEPINLVLLMDTSGSMGGGPVSAARSAASNFISSLGDQDRVAVLTFNDTVQNLVDFTTDKAAAIQKISQMDSVPDAGTCLYDAIYQAAQLTATVPSGRRAVVVFTDGVDENAAGGACSLHTVQDDLDLATGGSTRTPIYALGLGNRVDTNDLKRIASLTGGRDLFSEAPDQLEDMFQRLSAQLRSQYILRYTSVGGPGAHTLAVSLDYASARDNDTRNFLLPLFPARVSLSNISEGQEVTGRQDLIAEVSAQGDSIQRVTLAVNGEQIASDETRPYEFTVDFGGMQPGLVEVAAVAFGSDEVVLAQTSVTVTVSTAQTSEGSSSTTAASQIFPGSILSLIFLAGGIAAIFILRRRGEQARHAAQGKNLAASADAIPFDVNDDLGEDDSEPGTDTLGTLTVTASDDPSMAGHRFDLIQFMTHIGRSATNDIFFPRDTSVSSHQAKVEAKDGGMYLGKPEQVEGGRGSEMPTYEIFINERKLGTDPVRLQNGDEIRLGTSVRMKFQVARRTVNGNNKPATVSI